MVLSVMLFSCFGMRGECVADSVAVVKADSVRTVAKVGEYKFHPHELIVPGVMIAIGIGGYFLDGYYGLTDNVNKDMIELRKKSYFHADDYLQYLPAVAYLALGATRVKARHPFRERLAAGVTAYLAMAALTNIGKYTFREKRPDSNARNSFPSGHTATVFTGAELMRIEYGLAYGIPSYIVATGVAFLRMYNGRHWLNDVIAGAGIGILSARIGYWMLPLYRKWFGWDKKKKDAMLVLSPQYEPETRQIGIGMVYCW